MFFAEHGLDKEEFRIVDTEGREHDIYDSGLDAVLIAPNIGSKSFWKGFAAVAGVLLTVATGGALAGLSSMFGITGGLVHTIGMGLLCYAGGSLMMGRMKLPSMDSLSESSSKSSYNWSVGSLSTSRGIKGVTYGTVIPEGELLSFRTYGTSSIEEKYREESKIVGYKNIRGYYQPQWATNKVLDYSFAGADSASYLEMLIGAGEGPLSSISDIKVNGTAIEDLDGVEYEVRLGTNTQQAFARTNLDSQTGYLSVGQAAPQKLDGSDTPLVLTTPVECSSVMIAMQCSQFYIMDMNSGSKNRAYLKPVIKYRKQGTSAYTLAKTSIKEIDNEVPFKAESAFYFNVELKFPSKGIYEISVQNCSAELCYQKGAGGLGGALPAVLPDRAALAINVDNIACYDTVEHTYPGTALIWLRIPASQALNGSVPKVSWKQSRPYVDVWNGTQYVQKDATNLAWAIYDVLAQVIHDDGAYHNEGEDVHNFDYSSFADFARFCDTIGAKGNFFLSKQQSAWEHAQSLATSARAFISIVNGRITPFFDEAQTMTQIFTVADYTDFSGAFITKKDRATSIECTFNDENNNFEERTIKITIDGESEDENRTTAITFAGLSTADNVASQAAYILRRNKYLTDTVKFTADISSIVCHLNDVIGVQSDVTEYGVGGVITAVSGNTIDLDAPVTLEAGRTYSLLITHTDGTLERQQCDQTSGTFTRLTFNSHPFTKAVAVDNSYAFGVSGYEVKKYRVTGITRQSDLKAEIECIEYDENVYNSYNFDDQGYQNPNAGINSITTTYNPEGVDLAWNKTPVTAYVDVYVDGVYYGRFAEGATIPNVNSTQQIECVPVNAYGQEGTSVVRAISNSLPSPTQPPVPIVQPLPTGAVVQFSIPQNEYITWIIIKEGDEELGRSIVAGDEVTLNLNLEGGTHNLTAYFLNSYGKTSAGRDFTATPFGVDATMLSSGFIMRPQGSILNINAKGCTTESIKTAGGVIDGSGFGHHGQAYGGVSVLNGGEGFSFDGTTANAYIDISNNGYSFDNQTLTYSVKIKFNGNTSTSSQLQIILGHQMFELDYNYASDHKVYYSIFNSSNTRKGKWTDNAVTELLDGKAHLLTVTYDKTNLILYLDGIEKERMALTDDFTSQRGLYVGRVVNANYSLNANIYDFRIYPRALSAVEVKSLYMIPQEAVLSRVTADVIGANAVNAIHLNASSVTANAVGTNEIITNVANISQAVVNGLNVTGNATFQAGLASKNNYVYITSPYSATLATINDYSTRSSLLFTVGATEAAKVNVGDTVALKYAVTDVPSVSYVYIVGKCLTKTSTTVTLECQGYINPNSMSQTINAANAVKTGVGTLGYTSIHGGNIATETIEAGSIKAGAITAQKLNVEAIKKPRGEYLMLSMRGMNAPNTTDGICDISGNKRHLTGSNIAGFGVGTSDTGSYITFNGTSSYAKRTGISSIGNSYTFHMKVYLNSVPSFSYLCCVSSFSGTTETRQFGLWLNSSRQLYANVNGVDADLNCGVTLALGTIYTITATYNGSSLVVWVNGVKKATVSRTVAQNTGNILMLGARASGSGGSSYIYPVGMYLYDFAIYPRVISDNEIVTLYMLGIDPEAGQITADRIATDAVKSRNYSYSSGDFSTAGTFLDLANGAITSQNFCIKSDGSATFKGALSGATGSFSGNVTANSGKIGAMTISSDGGLVCNSTSSTVFPRVILANAYSNYSVGTNLLHNGLTILETSGTANRAASVHAGLIESTAANTSELALQVTGKVSVNGTIVHGSDRNIKSDIRQTSTLNKLKQLNVYSWKYDEDKLATKNGEKPKGIGAKNNALQIGPMAQDFNAMFGTNKGSQDYISYTDTIGVCMRAIQELANQLDDLKRQVRSYKRILNISDQQIADERNARAVRLLEVTKARQAKRELAILARNSEIENSVIEPILEAEKLARNSESSENHDY